MSKLEFIRNNVLGNIFPIGSKVRYHFRFSRWPIRMKVAKYIECTEAERNHPGVQMDSWYRFRLHNSSYGPDRCTVQGGCAHVIYVNKSGTRYCSKLNWRLVSE